MTERAEALAELERNRGALLEPSAVERLSVGLYRLERVCAARGAMAASEGE